MTVRGFFLTMGAGVAVGALGAMMLPKNSDAYRLTKQAAGCKIALSFKASLNKRISPNAMRKKSNAGHGHREPGMLGSRRQRLRERTLLSSNLNRKRPQ